MAELANPPASSVPETDVQSFCRGDAGACRSNLDRDARLLVEGSCAAAARDRDLRAAHDRDGDTEVDAMTWNAGACRDGRTSGSLVFASMGMLPGSQLIDPVSLAVVVSMQSGLVIPGYQRLLRVFRSLLDGFAAKVDEYFCLAPTNALDPMR